jgi:hypothetical protein
MRLNSQPIPGMLRNQGMPFSWSRLVSRNTPPRTSVSPPLINTVVLASRSMVLGMLSGCVTSPGVLEVTFSCSSTNPSAETCGTTCRTMPVVNSWKATA